MPKRSKKYDVHVFAVVRIKVPNIEATSQVEAIRKAIERVREEELAERCKWELRDGTYAEPDEGGDCAEYLVDEVGDESHQKTRRYLDNFFLSTLIADQSNPVFLRYRHGSKNTEREPSPLPPTVADFIQDTARFTKDGECATCGKDGSAKNKKCPEHEPWDMPNDDAVDTLHDTINHARELLPLVTGKKWEGK